MYKTWCADVANHQLDLLGYFGMLACENSTTSMANGTLAPGANPWATRSCADFLELERFDDPGWFAALVAKCTLLLFKDRDIGEAFLLHDMSIIRAEYLTVRIGPSGYQVCPAKQPPPSVCGW